jgi:hypothetical protein
MGGKTKRLAPHVVARVIENLLASTNTRRPNAQRGKKRPRRAPLQLTRAPQKLRRRTPTPSKLRVHPKMVKEDSEFALAAK